MKNLTPEEARAALEVKIQNNFFLVDQLPNEGPELTCEFVSETDNNYEALLDSVWCSEFDD